MNSHLAQMLANGGGAVSIEHFMRDALYHPDHGYYTRHAATVGRGGDFSTSATLDPILGQAIAHWLQQQKKTLSPRPSWHVIELGAGNGALAQSVLHHLGWWFRRRLQYHIVETSDGFTRLQQKSLQGHSVLWHREIESALRKAEGCALIFSNEFVDAFPCRVLQKVDKEWREVWVTHGSTGWQELYQPLAGPTLPPGQSLEPWSRVEVHQAYWEWWQRWTPLAKEVALLTIDYGELISDLYFRRPRGTLRAYFQHQRYQGSEVFERFGRQDLTADVNFTQLQEWGTALGWKNQRYGTQREFLDDHCPKVKKMANQRPEIAYLLSTEGPGGAFKFLHQSIFSL